MGFTQPHREKYSPLSTTNISCFVTDDLGQEVPAGVGEEVEEPDAGEDAHVVQDEHDDAVPK